MPSPSGSEPLKAPDPLYDRDIREGLFLFLEETYGTIRILEEKVTGKARADAVMVTPHALCGIEIKSDQDTYARLPGQVSYYDRYYDFNFIVVGLSHVRHVTEHVPPYWGIITAERTEQGLDFYLQRRPKRNPNVKPALKISILWRQELISIHKKYRLTPEGSKRKMAKFLMDVLPQDRLWDAVCSELFERDYVLYEKNARKR